jgi:PAS domain S-box-containing protein
MGKADLLSKVGGVAAAAAGLYLSSLYSYLLFHNLIEITTIAIAFSLFILTWNTKDYLESGYLKLLGIGYAFIALIDLLHTLAYKGMGVFPSYDANLPTQLWIVARYLQAIALLAAPFLAGRKVSDYAVAAGCATAVILAVATVYSGGFPDCFVEGKGLTEFKIASEYVISAILVVSFGLLYWRRHDFEGQVFLLIASSIVLTIISELSFTAYVSVYGFANMLGHFAKLAAFYLIYRAILVTGFKKPFSIIFRELKAAEDGLRGARDTLERKVLERTAELKCSEERLRSLIQNVPTAIVLHDGRGLILESNLLAQELLGLSADQLLGKELIDPEWHFLREDGSILPITEYPVSLVLSTGQPLRGYLVGVKRPGVENAIWVLVNALPEHDAAGAISQIIVSFIDVTQRKQVEEALFDAQQVFRTLVENSPDIIARYDRNCQRTYVNPTYLKVAKIPQKELIATAPRQRSPLPAASATALQDLLHRVLDSGVAEAIDVPWPKEDGQDYWYNIYAYPEFDREGRVASVMTVSRDISERKRSELALDRLNRELTAISNCNQILVRAEDEQTLLDAICRIICDEAGYRLTWVGYAENDTAKSIRPVAWGGFDDGYVASANLSWAEDNERGRGPGGTAIRSGETVCVQDCTTDPGMSPWRENALRRGYCSILAMPLKDDRSVVFGVLLIYSAEVNAFTPDETALLEELAGDLSFGITALRTRADRQRAEMKLHETVETLTRLNAALQRFAGITAHDLQEPVRTIVSFSQMLERHLGESLDGTGREYLDFIVAGARRMRDLVRDLLSYTRLSNRQVAHLQVDAGVVVAAACDNARSLIDERKAVIECDPLPCVLGDRMMLTELFQNIIVNGIKFTPLDRSPKIHISAVPEKDLWRFAVSDQGIGIAAAYHGRIFEIFQRLHTGSTYPGTGIGLALCKEIVEQHGGRIWVESEEGKGATFLFTLRAAPIPSSPA